MREMFVETKHELGECGSAHDFKYYVLIDQMQVSGGFACESYGVKIVDEAYPDQAVSIPNITTSISRIDELMELLTRNSVTPTTLGDVVADWL